MFKRFFSLLIVGILLFSLVGCGEPPVNTDTDTDSSSATSTQKKTVDNVFYNKEHLVGLCEQKHNRIIVCDLTVEDWSNDQAVVWEFKSLQHCRNVAGIKLRYNDFWGGLVVLFCGASGAGVISYETKKVLWFTSQAGNNPHSIEMLPDGNILVASSTGNEVRTFAATQGKTTHNQILTFENAHGVLWDPKYEVVWMNGINKLGAAIVGGTIEKPTLSLVPDMQYTAPNNSMHDLAPVYGDPDSLFVTTAGGVLKFNKVTEKFNKGYPGSSTAGSQGYVPGVGNFRDNDVLVFTTIRKDTMVHSDWCTNMVYVYIPLDNGRGKLIRLIAEDDAYYKVRVWCPDYQ